MAYYWNGRFKEFGRIGFRSRANMLKHIATTRPSDKDDAILNYRELYKYNTSTYFDKAAAVLGARHVVNENSAFSTVTINIEGHGRHAIEKKIITKTGGVTDTLPTNLRDGVAIFSFAAPNGRSFENRADGVANAAIIKKQIRTGLPTMKFFEALQNVITKTPDENGNQFHDIIKTNQLNVMYDLIPILKSSENTVLLLSCALLATIYKPLSILQPFVEDILRQKIDERNAHYDIADTYKETYDAITSNRIGNIYNPISDIVFSSDERNVENSNIDADTEPDYQRLVITITEVVYPKNVEQLELRGANFNELSNSGIETRIITKTTENPDTNETYARTYKIQVAHLSDILRYLKDDCGFDNVLITMQTDRTDEHETDAARQLFKDAKISQKNLSPDEKHARQNELYDTFLSDTLDTAIGYNHTIRSIGGKARRFRRTQATRRKPRCRRRRHRRTRNRV